MTCSFMVSATNSATTVHMFEKIQTGDQISKMKTEVNANTNCVVANWEKHKILPSAPSPEVDAAFVWASVFDRTLLQPLSSLVRSDNAFGTALMFGFSYGSMPELLKCVPLESMNDEVLFYIFKDSLQRGRKAWAKQFAHILVGRDSPKLGLLFSQMMKHSTPIMLSSPDVMRIFNSDALQTARTDLLGLGVVHDYPPFLKWYKTSACALLTAAVDPNVHGWDTSKISAWAQEEVARQQKKTLVQNLPKSHNKHKSKL